MADLERKEKLGESVEIVPNKIQKLLGDFNKSVKNILEDFNNKKIQHNKDNFQKLSYEKKLDLLRQSDLYKGTSKNFENEAIKNIIISNNNIGYEELEMMVYRENILSYYYLYSQYEDFFTNFINSNLTLDEKLERLNTSPKKYLKDTKLFEIFIHSNIGVENIKNILNKIEVYDMLNFVESKAFYVLLGSNKLASQDKAKILLTILDNPQVKESFIIGTKRFSAFLESNISEEDKKTIFITLVELYSGKNLFYSSDVFRTFLNSNISTEFKKEILMLYIKNNTPSLSAFGSQTILIELFLKSNFTNEDKFEIFSAFSKRDYFAASFLKEHCVFLNTKFLLESAFTDEQKTEILKDLLINKDTGLKNFINSPETLGIFCNSSLKSEIKKDFIVKMLISQKYENNFINNFTVISTSNIEKKDIVEITSNLGIYKEIKNNLVSENYDKLINFLVEQKYYFTQNTLSLKDSLDLIKDNKIDDIISLITKNGGFTTKKLLKNYISLENIKEKEELLNMYKNNLNEVLSSEKIVVDKNNAELLSEIIYMAYRPTGFSEDQIQQNLLNEKILDHSDRVEKLNFPNNGYKKQIVSVKHNIEGVDLDIYKNIDNILFSELNLEQYINNLKGDESIDFQKIFYLLLKDFGDYRIKGYIENYNNSQDYDYERIQKLGEIISIIPKEDTKFLEYIKTNFINNKILSKKINETQQNILKKKISGILGRNNQKLTKTQIKHNFDNNINIANFAQNLLNPNVVQSELINDFSIKVSNILEQKDDINQQKFIDKFIGIQIKKHLSTLEITQDEKDKIYNFLLKEYKFKITGNYGYFEKEILKSASTNSKELKQEQEKITQENSGKSLDIQFMPSMNIGSFYAKAGAGLCTAENVELWDEERHIHLNMINNHQILGNIMLFIEPERDYLVVRGFNPRADFLQTVDVDAISKIMIETVKEFAKENNFEKVYIPKQSGWHELSNRDQVGKSVWNNALKNRDHKDFEIETKFECSNEGHHTINYLYKI